MFTNTVRDHNCMLQRLVVDKNEDGKSFLAYDATQTDVHFKGVTQDSRSMLASAWRHSTLRRDQITLHDVSVGRSLPVFVYWTAVTMQALPMDGRVLRINPHHAATMFYNAHIVGWLVVRDARAALFVRQTLSTELISAYLLPAVEHLRRAEEAMREEQSKAAVIREQRREEFDRETGVGRGFTKSVVQLNFEHPQPVLDDATADAYANAYENFGVDDDVRFDPKVKLQAIREHVESERTENDRQRQLRDPVSERLERSTLIDI